MRRSRLTPAALAGRPAAKRPEPVAFQLPLGVKGRLERTQVAPDRRLVLFAAEPDIAKPIFVARDERERLWLAETCDYPRKLA